MAQSITDFSLQVDFVSAFIRPLGLDHRQQDTNTIGEQGGRSAGEPLEFFWSMNLSFIIATEADAAVIVGLRNAATEFLTRKYGQGVWSGVASERSPLKDLRRPKFSRTLIARNGDKAVATLRLATKKPWAIDAAYFTAVTKALYLTDMAVHPDAQRQGIGRLMLNEAEAMALQWPVNAIRLDAFNAGAGAGPFYAKCGYREVGRVVYRDAPLIYFERVLS